MIGTVLNERFLLESELGRGGMGAVYRATDQLLGRSVAIKVLKDLSGEEVGRKIRLEAQILARLLHQNIVRLYDFGIADGTYFLVMEEVDGTSFNKRWKAIDLPSRLRIVAEVAEALDYAHHQSIVHRDVKPANILLTAGDEARLSDFGLSLLVGESDETGVTRGTPHYMSPEQARGRKLDHRSDLYALGIILFECATGTTPFHGQPMAVMAQHVNQAPPSPRTLAPEIPEALDALILKLLAKDPAGRPASGKAIAAELRRIVPPASGSQTTVAATTPGPEAGTVAAVPIPSTRADSAPRSEPGPSPIVATPATTAAHRPSDPVATSLPAAPPSLGRSLLEVVEAEPIVLEADQRYLAGHYLAYLLGGTRRSGFLGRRNLDRRNADRGRLLLAMTSIMTTGTLESVGRAAELLESKEDVRPLLNPILVAKYLTSRDAPTKLKRFRQARRKLKDASAYAQAKMIDGRNVLNPGMIPQSFDDLRKIAPERSEIDDDLVERWNRLAEVWRSNFEFRDAVLRYATRSAYLDPSSVGLWPEVVYPLIERARWQRRHRPPLEAIWDVLCGNLRLPDAGVRLDKVMHRVVPDRVAARLDDAVIEFEEEPRIGDDEGQASGPGGADRLSMGDGLESASFHDLAAELDDAPARGVVRLASADPNRLLLGELGSLWREALAALKSPNSKTVHRHVPIGPYRLVVIPSIRGKSAGTIAIQGMANKQIELLVPSLRAVGSSSRPILATWVYDDNSLAIAYVDFQGQHRYILWDASTAQQSNFEEPSLLTQAIYQIGLEAPEQLDRALSKRFRPRDPA